MSANSITLTGITTATMLIAIVAWVSPDISRFANILDSVNSGPLFDAATFWTLLASLFAIMNPLVAVPFFATITEGHSKKYQGRLAMTATFAVIVVLVLAALLGNEILAFFAISIGAFRIAGGIIVLLMGLALIRADSDSNEGLERIKNPRSQAVCPIAIPLMAGPGAIATIIVQWEGASSTCDFVTLTTVMFAMVAIVYFTLRAAVPVARYLGNTGLSVASRVFGMIVIAIAIDMTIIGMGLLFPRLL